MPIPSLSATRRMDNAPSPSASATSMAAPTIRPTLSPGFGPLVGFFPIPHNNAMVRFGSPPPLYSSTISHNLSL